MNWRPRIRVGVAVGVALLALIVLVDAGLIWRVQRGPHNGITFLYGLAVLISLVAIAVVAYRIYDLTQLCYEFDRNRLMIARAGTRYIIPLKSIVQTIAGGQADADLLGQDVQFRGVRWPGCYIGEGEIAGIGTTLFQGVTLPHKQLIVVTPSLAYGLSVPDLDAFHQVLAACSQLGPSAEVRHESVQAPYMHWPIWRDRAAQGLVAAGILLSALLFAVLLFRYPSLPDRLPMHYDEAGRVDHIAPRIEAFDLPLIGLFAWATNGILGTLFYRRQRMIAYLAWSGTLIVQTLFLIALWDLVH
jgi:hypothetical protein